MKAALTRERKPGIADIATACRVLGGCPLRIEILEYLADGPARAACVRGEGRASPLVSAALAPLRLCRLVERIPGGRVGIYGLTPFGRGMLGACRVAARIEVPRDAAPKAVACTEPATDAHGWTEREVRLRKARRLEIGPGDGARPDVRRLALPVESRTARVDSRKRRLRPLREAGANGHDSGPWFLTDAGRQAIEGIRSDEAAEEIAYADLDDPVYPDPAPIDREDMPKTRGPITSFINEPRPKKTKGLGKRSAHKAAQLPPPAPEAAANPESIDQDPWMHTGSIDSPGTGADIHGEGGPQRQADRATALRVEDQSDPFAGAAEG